MPHDLNANAQNEVVGYVTIESEYIEVPWVTTDLPSGPETAQKREHQ